jgi:Xaa-Pro aminopeptidase
LSRTTEALRILTAIRGLMAERDLDAYVIPSADEHQSEFRPSWRRRRELASGFTGTAGDLLVGRDEAWLFVDGRYLLQARGELEGTGIQTLLSVLPDGVPLDRHVRRLAQKSPGFRLGANLMVLRSDQHDQLKRALATRSGELVDTPDLVDAVWTDRPLPEPRPLMALPPAWTGATTATKLATIRADVEKLGGDGLVLSALEPIAWLLNLRARDEIPYNPVFEAHLLLDRHRCQLFLHGGRDRLPGDAGDLEIEVQSYDEFPAGLLAWKPEARSGTACILADPRGVASGVMKILTRAGHRVIGTTSPVDERKAVKSPAEQEAARRANLAASVAKTRAFLWLRQRLRAGDTVTEESFARQLERHYAEEDGYLGLSFPTISGTGAHGAIIHYTSCDGTELRRGDLFLVDSGAHIAGGSTDCTRTVSIGVPSEESRRLHTLVLRGHIQAAAQTLPDGVPGACLDTLARSPLWNEGLDYLHGTGHGIGAFLNIHEGPFGLSRNLQLAAVRYPMRAGMITSIEPGYYREGWGGIRIENLYLLAKKDGMAESDTGWLAFECLTWIPFDPSLIDRSRLESREVEWLDAYQAQCRVLLEPRLDPTERLELEGFLAEGLPCP